MVDRSTTEGFGRYISTREVSVVSFAEDLFQANLANALTALKKLRIPIKWFLENILSSQYKVHIASIKLNV